MVGAPLSVLASTSMSEPGENLERILSATPVMLSTGSLAGIAPLLDEEVVWQGPRPELVCHGREEVMGILGRAATRRLLPTRIEAEEFHDRVVVSVESPDLPETPALAAGAPRSLVFTFRDGKIVRIESFASREAALELAAG